MGAEHETPQVGPRKAAVLGKPIEHSKSPLLHRAAYRALGLDGWTYDRIECDAEALPGLVSGLGPEWVGLSVTMPGKFAALEFATERTERAVAVGSANTLVRVPGGWRADCTDVDGIVGALAELGLSDLAGARAVVIGAGGTSRPALVGLASLGAGEVTVVARSAERARGALDCGRNAGLAVSWGGFEDDELRSACGAADVVISTVPAAAVAPVAGAVAAAPRVLDVIYDPWPTPLAMAVEAAGGTVVGGLSMLLNQAFGQVEQFTDLPAPREAMAAALR
ncbi:shikimate dehydrogenase [Rhodococcus sp. D2-41]|uniref:shikimate dehydrogenase (NADP(+)) n=1 Tax=Speluncibacter jeojiensis TaxID=2710754 RepID=A0A9X4REL2_9ACTN|nr:shikimate dehydrogenase [Rhodococcus sp. D2-41]MDG3011274.1 shikimate dehydrogenase [Rhodococcus sp. D2-41]MDG3015874.1 shikimate dehydrogenase [Corynebacteriales bacterium D3-21]